MPLLGILEKNLFGILKSKINDVDVISGPVEGDGGNVRIYVESLENQEPDDGEKILSSRDISYLSEVYTFNTTGRKSNFKLPIDMDGEICEVETPQGFPAKAGDDYFVEDNTIKFYKPPQKGTPGLAVFFKGDKAKGFIETSPCRINIKLEVKTKDYGKTDLVFLKSLNALTASFPEMGTVRTFDEENGVGYRILKPALFIKSIERNYGESKKEVLFKFTSHVVLFCGLETTVATGRATDESVIEEIHYKTDPVIK